MTQRKHTLRSKHLSRFARSVFPVLALAIWSLAVATSSDAQVVQADYDYEASGFVTPAGAVPMQFAMPQNSGVMPVGYFPSGAISGGASSACDAPGGCSSPGCAGGCANGPTCGVDSSSGGCDGGGCDGNGCASGCVGGIFGQLGGKGLACGGCGQSGCRCCGGLSNLRHMCIFCRGAGCSACQLRNKGGLFGYGALGSICGLVSQIEPYSDGGLCQQRWYDFSLGLMFLGKTSATPGVGNGVTSQGVGPNQIVLGADDLDSGNLEEGLRLSGALLFGPGSNLEATWIGGHEWGGFAQAQDQNAQLFSFISEFGAQPGGTVDGFDDTDRSVIQSIRSESDFDSFELNYRRRTVWPCCRFQGSWLVGLRYISFDDAFTYSTQGTVNNTGGANLLRFFNSRDQVENSMFGVHGGGDFWWNINPGFSFGLGAKLGWLQNDYDRSALLSANSLGAGATPGTASLNAGDQESTFMGEFEAKFIYRLTHSWSLRSSYYLVGVEDVAYGGVDVQATTQFVDPTRQGNTPVLFGDTQLNSLIVQGFSIEAEFMW